MTNLNQAFIFGFLLSSCAQTSTINLHRAAIIPQPKEVNQKEGYFEVLSSTRIAVENQEQKRIAEEFLSELRVVSGFSLTVEVGDPNAEIKLNTDLSIGSESYRIESDPKQITINAASPAGFFYAFQTLRQLLPIELVSGKKQDNIKWLIPAIVIDDSPVFGWRGYMLDVSRHFFTVSQVREVLDFMAENKLNRFHWHLTDDQGWRLEIKSYPRLTEVGAWRVDHNITDENTQMWFGRPVQKPGDVPTYGGFYSQDEVKEIIAYAKDRFIEVIPEIDMPGHAQATVAAYPEIGCVNAFPYVATGAVVENNTYNPGKEETFQFVEKLLNEVMDLFPFDYIHIGGDECNKSQWKVDPHAQRRMKEEGLKNEEELQSYFIKRVENIINARGRKMIGWDEILEGGLAPNATVMSWRGEAGGIAAARAGHNVIMTPNKYCYIDLKQGHDDLEPNLGYSRLLLSTAYNYKVLSDSLTEEERKYVLGIQANMWSESLSDWDKLTYMNYPRLYAIAENAWTRESDQNWDDFTRRLMPQLARLDQKGTRYAVSAFSPWIDHKGNGQTIEINMKTEVNDLNILYTLDGSEPTPSSNFYSGPFVIDSDAVIKAASFRNDKPFGYTSKATYPVHRGGMAEVVYHTPYMESKDGGGRQSLTDYNYAKLTASDNSWQGFMGDMEVDIILSEKREVKGVQLTALRWTISRIYLPENVEVFGSIDGVNYEKLGEVEQLKEALIQGRNKYTTMVSFNPTILKSLKVKARSVNSIPKGNFREGEPTKIYVDEIVLL